MVADHPVVFVKNRSHAFCREAQWRGVGLEQGAVAAADEGVEQSEDAQPFEDGADEVGGLVGDDAEFPAARFECAQDFRHVGVQDSAVEEVRAVVRPLVLEERVELVGAFGDGAGQQGADAFADGSHDGGFGQGGQTEVGAGEVHSQGEVGAGVNQCAV